MPNYRKLCNILIAELSEIIDKAKMAIDNAEDEILSESEGSKILQLYLESDDTEK